MTGEGRRRVGGEQEAKEELVVESGHLLSSAQTSSSNLRQTPEFPESQFPEWQLSTSVALLVTWAESRSPDTPVLVSNTGTLRTASQLVTMKRDSI